MKRRLITSALPYVNNVPHLGNLIQVLSADVFARSCRLRGFETLYICGTDEYGTATETKAALEGISPKELCDRFHAIHKSIYSWFEIAFDKFGRTSDPRQTEITQSIFKDLDAAGLIKEETIEQLYCEHCNRFLADRYVEGVCPHCGYKDARGDQCEACGTLLDPTELKEPRCSSCGSTPKLKSTKHLYIDLPAIKPRLEKWMSEASVKGSWSNNAIQMTQAWIRDGLKPRAITRDLKWGIPVPKEGFENKVFYVWFDAPIGYISMTATAGDEQGFDWKNWWQNQDDVELYQFIGKDNIPFHTVIFPSSLLGSNRKWTLLHHMSSTEYLNYESGKFSKSKGIGVFGTDVKETGIAADVWRFYIFYNRPERSDFTFTWADFLEKVNGELIGNLGNLANRTLAFINRFYDGKIPEAKPNEEFWNKVRELEDECAKKFENADLKDAFKTAFQISDIANKRFQEEEPWKARTENPEKAASLLSDLCYVLRDLAVIMTPFMPKAMNELASFFGLKIASAKGETGLTWKDIGKCEGLSKIEKVGVLFQKLDPDKIDEFRIKYSGSQAERAARDAEKKEEQKVAPKKEPKKKEPKQPLYADLPVEQRFAKLMDLRVAKIIKVERHPDAEKLYIEHLDDGTGQERVIISGIVPFYKEEELVGKNIVLVNNLKPAKLRGIMSYGMLLAASINRHQDGEQVEVLNAPWAKPGSRVILEGQDPEAPFETQIDADDFFSVPICAKDGNVFVGDKKLCVESEVYKLEKVQNGEVG